MMLPGVSNAEKWNEQKQDEATQSYFLPRSLDQKTREKRGIRNQYLQSSVSLIKKQLFITNH